MASAIERYVSSPSMSSTTSLPSRMSGPRMPRQCRITDAMSPPLGRGGAERRLRLRCRRWRRRDRRPRHEAQHGLVLRPEAARVGHPAREAVLARVRMSAALHDPGVAAGQPALELEVLAPGLAPFV